MELITISEIGRLLDKVGMSLDHKERNVYLFILGNQTKKAIVTLPDYIDGIKLLWSGWSGPGWMKFLGFFAAGHAGLFRIIDSSKLKELALEASLGGLIQIVVTKASVDRELHDLITENGVSPQLIRENITWEYENTLIEISCDTNEGSEAAGYVTSFGLQNL